MTGTITQLRQDQGVGALLGEDRKIYTFRRGDVHDVWFHELTAGVTVAFAPGKHLSATRVRPCSSGATS